MNGKQLLAALEAISSVVQGKKYSPATGFLARAYEIEDGEITAAKDADAAGYLSALAHNHFGAPDGLITLDIVAKARRDLGLVAYRQPNRRPPTPPAATGDQGRTLFDVVPVAQGHPLPGNGNGHATASISAAAVVEILEALATKGIRIDPLTSSPE